MPEVTAPPGSITFIPTGETRVPHVGEWYNTPAYAGEFFVKKTPGDLGKFPIYRRVDTPAAGTYVAEWPTPPLAIRLRLDGAVYEWTGEYRKVNPGEVYKMPDRDNLVICFHAPRGSRYIYRPIPATPANKIDGTGTDLLARYGMLIQTGEMHAFSYRLQALASEGGIGKLIADAASKALGGAIAGAVANKQ